MQITETICDRCSNRGASSYGVTIGRTTDAAGSGEDITLEADLCLPCVATLFSATLQKFPNVAEFLRGLRASNPLGNQVFIEHP